MALKVNCNRCTDPTCSGQEYTVDFDYWDNGRQRGTKIVCFSQIYDQGRHKFHIIKTKTHEHRFEAEIKKPPEEVIVEHTIETVVNQTGREATGESRQIQTERATALRNQEKIHREMSEDEAGWSK